MGPADNDIPIKQQTEYRGGPGHLISFKHVDPKHKQETGTDHFGPTWNNYH